jgi:copper(I)-binding protein
MKPALLASFALVAPIVLLAGCDDKPDPAKVAVSGEMTIADGKLVLPAVSGSPAAAYFTVTNGTKDAVSLAAVTVEGARKAEMHQTDGGSMSPIATLNMGPGASVPFERGSRHVMVFSPGSSLKPGGTTKLTLTFSGGKTASAPLAIEAAGGADMAGMDH